MGFLQRIKEIFSGNDKHIIAENAKKLRNIQAMAYYIACEKFDRTLYPDFTAIPRNDRNYDQYGIFYLSKLFANRIILEDITETLVGNEDRQSAYLKRFFEFNDENRHRWKYLDEKFYQPFNLANSIVVNLKDVPAISNVWQKSRLARGIAEIGTPKNPWKEQHNDKHRVSLFLPMSLLVVTESGNHSIATGVLKSVGSITVGGDSRHKIYDMSELYQFMSFDGTYYRKRADNSIICRAKSFDFGAIFEIGRIVKEYNISFLEFCLSTDRQASDLNKKFFT